MTTTKTGRGIFNFLNIAKVEQTERDYLASIAKVAIPETLYANHSGEWFASKKGSFYSIVSFDALVATGFEKSAGIAGSLRGVREVVEVLHTDRETAKRSNPWM